MAFDIEKAAVKEFANHVMVEVPARSFHFRSIVPVTEYVAAKAMERARFKKSSFYSFTLTWAPGVLTVSGDIGEIVITHGDLMSFDEGIKWAAASDYDYLMGKSNLKKEYDPDKTFKSLVEDANRELISYIQGDRSHDPAQRKWVYRGGFRRALCRYRKEVADGQIEFAEAHRQWLGSDRTEDEPEIGWFVPSFPDDEDYKITRRPDAQKEALKYKLKGDRLEFEIPDLWDSWARLGEAYGIGETIDLTKSATRREIREWLKDLCSNQYELAKMLRDAGEDDYFGSYSYPQSSHWQFAAIKHACETLIERLKAGDKEQQAA
jgi:hypothetical protein